MAYYKTINPANIKSVTSNLNQLIDFADADVSGSVSDSTRKTYQVFVTGSTPGVTSSLFHTVFDQTTTLQSANELFDITFGIHSSSNAVSFAASSPSEDQTGKLLFTSRSLMMREKIDIYRQHAQLLLGNGSNVFVSPFAGSNVFDPASDVSNNITEALFINLKRLFVRDGIKKESFAMRFMTSASSAKTVEDHTLGATGQQNIFRETGSGSIIIVDAGASSDFRTSPSGGEYAVLKNAANSKAVGLIFYQQGTVILDLNKVTSGSQFMSGTIAADGNTSGKIVMGAVKQGAVNSKFIPHFITSASIDDVINHVCTTRFHSASAKGEKAQNKTFMTFQNNTKINSTLVFCRAAPDEFNVSSNPTFANSAGVIRTIDGEENEDKSFTFVTTVGLYDANRNLMAVSKLSRPVEKNDEKDLTFRIRLDF